MVIALVLTLAASACSFSREALTVDVPTSAESSRIFDRDGRLITVVHGGENRETIELDAVSQYMQDAVVSIEDERFWQHQGVDFKAIVRAAKENAAAGSFVEGGSTLEMQLVENLILGADRTLEDKQSIENKLEEFALAQQLDETYTKSWILESYLNTVFFCNNAWGVQAAAEEYFAKDAINLTLGESAMLAGMIQRPCDFDPFDNLERGLERRELVLRAMVRNGYVDESEAARAIREDLQLAEETPVLEEEYQAPHFVDEVRAWFFDNPAFGETREERRDLFFEGGLEIHTTIDLDMQFGAVANVASVLGTDNATPRGALVSIEPGTGRIRTMVGGLDYFSDSKFSKVNLAMGQGRQPGSSFKPLVLAAALDNGMALATTFPSPGTTEFEIPGQTKPWKVSNYSGTGTGDLDLTEMTVTSSNTAFATLMLQLGAQAGVQMASELGVRNTLTPDPSAVLGSVETTVLDMASAYSTFAAEGIATDPVMVERVIAPDGSEIYRAPPTARRVIDEDVANRVTGVLSQVVERGTGTRAQLADRPVAGKTGTTQNWSDAWFVGYTPELATAVWVGFPEGQISMRPPETPIRVTGGSWPAEIWQGYNEYVLANTDPLEFPEAPPEPARDLDRAGVVPDLVGRTAAPAVRELSRRGLFGDVIEVPPQGLRRGLVVGQSPPAGTPLSQGEIVTLTVTGQGPAPFISGNPGANRGGGNNQGNGGAGGNVGNGANGNPGGGNNGGNNAGNATNPAGGVNPQAPNVSNQPASQPGTAIGQNDGGQNRIGVARNRPAAAGE